MDFLVEKRKLDAAVREVKAFLDVNGIHICRSVWEDERNESVSDELQSCQEWGNGRNRKYSFKMPEGAIRCQKYMH